MGADLPSSDVGPLALALQRRHSFTGDRSSSRANFKVAQNPFAASRQPSHRPLGPVNFMPEQVNYVRPAGQTPSVTGVAYMATAYSVFPSSKAKPSVFPKSSSRSATPPPRAPADANYGMAALFTRPQSSGSLPTNIMPPNAKSTIAAHAKGSHLKPPAAPSGSLTRTDSLSRSSNSRVNTPEAMGPLSSAVSARLQAAAPPPPAPVFTASLDSETWRSICEEGRAEADRKRGFYLPPDNRSELKQWLAHDIMLRHHVPNHPISGTRTVPLHAIPVMPPARPAPPPPVATASVAAPVAPSFRQWTQGQMAEIQISQQQFQKQLAQQVAPPPQATPQPQSQSQQAQGHVSQQVGLRVAPGGGLPRPSAVSAGSGSSDRSQMGTAVGSSGASACSSPSRDARSQ